MILADILWRKALDGDFKNIYDNNDDFSGHIMMQCIEWWL